MKKIILALVAFMFVLGMTQCKKEQPTNVSTDEGEIVYITMKVADDGAKHTVYPGTGAVVYGDGDVIYVGNNGHYVGTLTYANGAFSGSITSPSPSDYLHFYFTGGKTPATAPTAGSTESFTVSIADQSTNLPVLSYGRSNIKYVDGTTAYTCMLENKCGLVKFVPSQATPNPITVSGMKTTATINFATPGITPTDATSAVTLYSVSNSEKWAILLPQEEVTTATAIVPDFVNTTSFIVPTITSNCYLNGGIAMNLAAIPEGAIKGLFSVSATKKVFFSKGNLQYNKSNGKWSFMEHQYDVVETEYQGVGNNYASQNVISLFGWGTSGYNHGAKCYQPWSTSSTASDYYAYGVENNNLYDEDGKADWGYNAISNGGDTENSGWRTLTGGTNSEWNYLINRSTTSGIRFAKAIVNGVNGVILLPDNWTASTYVLNSTNTPNADFTTNTITADDWTNILEDNGAVFLPAGGLRYFSSEIGVVGTQGRYWSSSYSYNGNALLLTFRSDYLGTTTYNLSCCYGCLVRLVRDAN